MTERQFRHMLTNGALRGERLFESAAAAALLRRTARAVRARQAAQDAWCAIVGDEWAACSRVASVVDGVATIECSDAVQRERIRREAPSLLNQMRSKTRSVRALYITDAQGRSAASEDTDAGS